MPTYTKKIDGREYTVDAESEPSEAEIRAFIARQSAPASAVDSAPTSAPAPVAAQSQANQYAPMMAAAARAGGMGGLGMSAPIQPEYGPNIVRYGVPVAAGLATGGAGFIPTVGTGLVSSFLSEAGAQGMERMQGTRSEYSPREMGAAGVMGMAAPTRLAPRMLPAVSNFLASSAVNVGSSELGRFIQEGEVKKPSSVEETTLRFGLPVGLASFSSFAGSKNAKAQTAKIGRDDLILSRGGGSVMLSEILPDYTGLEAKVIRDGNEFAIKALNNLDVEIGPMLAKTYEGAKDSAEIAGKLSPHVGQLTSLQALARTSRDEAIRLERQAAEAIASQRADALKLRADAKDAAMTAAKDKYVYDQGLERIFGGVSQRIGTVVNGASMDNLRSIARASKDSVEAGLDRAYANLNIGLNDPVVSVGDIVKSATKASAKGLGLEGDIAKTEFVNALGASLKTLDPTGSGVISLEGYRKFRDSFVRELTEVTKDPNYANRVASSSYGIIKEAADSYIAKNIPAKSEIWKLTNAQAAAVYGAKKSNVIELLAEGDMNGVLSLMKKEGTVAPILNEVNAYADAITGLGGSKSLNAANRFKKDFLGAIRDTLVEDSLNFGKGQDSAAKIVDFPKLITTLDELRQRKFPVELLDLGSAKDIRQLARVSSAGGEGGMTSDQFSKYIQNRKNLGEGAAAARTAYDRAYKDFLISNDVKNRANAAARMSKEAKAANFKAGEIEEAQILAKQDPIIALLGNMNMGLSKDASQNGRWVASLFSMSPSVVGQFVDALQTSGRTTTVLEDLKKSAMATVMRDTFSKTDDVAMKRINSKNALNFFQGENGAARREILKTLMGKEEYANFEKNFSKPLERIVNTRELLGDRYSDFSDLVRPAVSAKGLLESRATGATLFKTAFDNVKKLVDEQRYNTIYALYVNPSTANAYAAAAYDADKFIKSSAANSFALKLAMEEDNRNLSQQAPSR
jgi:hypothetical protein